jgi:hypothetical protein
MITFRRQIGSLVGLLALSSSGFAATISQTSFVGDSSQTALTSSTCAAGAGSGCQLLNFPQGGGDLYFSVAQFNNALGTLNSVTIDLIGTSQTTTTVTNLSSTQAQITGLQANLDFFTDGPSLTAPTTQTFNTTVPLTTTDTLILAQTASVNFTQGRGTPAISLNPSGSAGSATTFATGAIDQFSLSPATSTGDWNESGFGVSSGIFTYNTSFSATVAPFAGSSSTLVYIPVYTALNTTISASGSVGASAVGYGAAELIVNYNYTPVSTTPEPTTMVLFGSALVGFGLLRKRARS